MSQMNYVNASKLRVDDIVVFNYRGSKQPRVGKVEDVDDNHLTIFDLNTGDGEPNFRKFCLDYVTKLERIEFVDVVKRVERLSSDDWMNSYSVVASL